MPDTHAPEIRADYLRGVELFLAGEAEQAVEALRPLVAQDPRPELLLALGKALLELRRGQEAGECFRRLRSGGTLEDTGLDAYVRLLAAVATALAGRPDEALRELDDVMTAEPRLERAARSLKRRLEAGRPPVLRF
jgi:tetratricopeptide (TPR) repeat protein